MYLHLGQNTIVPDGEIVGLFDLDNSSYSHLTRKFLEQAQREGRVVNVSDELPKSFVLCETPEGPKVYISQLSTATLLRRSESGLSE
jgi:hypothetical protein